MNEGNPEIASANAPAIRQSSNGRKYRSPSRLLCLKKPTSSLWKPRTIKTLATGGGRLGTGGIDFPSPSQGQFYVSLTFNSPVLVAPERLSSRITIKGLVAKVLSSVCIVHTLAASCRSHMGAMDLCLTQFSVC
jgi:hypothetical protein